MTDNFYKSEIDRELLLNIEIQKQNLKALPDKFKAQKKVVSPVTQQMIDDYKKQFRDLYKRGTGDTSQFFKFLIPGAVPEILNIKDIVFVNKLIDNGTLKKMLTTTEINEKNKELNALVNTYMKIENETIQDVYDNINKSREEINNLSGLIKKQKTNKLNPKRLITITELENEIKKSQENINKLKIDNGNNMTKANELKKELEENDENILFNDKYLYTLEQNDKKKRDEYAETLKRMNEGQIDVTRGQFESEEDYFKRLSDVALIEEDLTIVYLFNNNEFKKNLKTIVPSEWKIENISKAFTNDDKFLLNKTIAGFKKYFKENVGIGNKNLEVDEYVALIKGYLDSEGVKFIKGVSQDKKETKEDDTKTFISAFTKKEEETKEEETKEDDEEDAGIDYDDIFGYNIEIPDPVSVTGSVIPEVKATKINKQDIKTPLNELSFKNIKLSKEDDILKVSNIDKGEELYTLYFKLKEPTNKKGVGANEVIEYSYDGINYNESRKGQQFNTDLNFYLSEIGINDNDRKVFLYMIDNSRSINNYTDRGDTNTKINPTKFITFFKSFKSGSGLRKSKRKKIIVQKGASVKQVDKFVEFGNLILLLRKLYDTNVLSIKDKNGINIPGIPNQKVNDNFVNLILKIVNNEDVNLKDIDDLNEKDSILFTVLMNKAGLKKKYQINNVRTLEALSKRLELLEGEFEAGNDNDLMIKELYEIVFKLAYLGAITLSNAKKHYKQTIQLLKKN